MDGDGQTWTDMLGHLLGPSMAMFVHARPYRPFRPCSSIFVRPGASESGCTFCIAAASTTALIQ